MRRFLVPVLILFTAAVGFTPRLFTALQAAEKAPTEAKDDAKKEKDSDAAKKEAAAKTEADAKTAKSDAKAAEKAEKKDKEKASAEAAKDKTAKSEEKKADAKTETKKRKTQKVEAKRLKIDVPLDGTFVPRKMDEINFKPKAWSEYEIVEVADLGAKVHKGETLFKFDDTKINEAIHDILL